MGNLSVRGEFHSRADTRLVIPSGGGLSRQHNGRQIHPLRYYKKLKGPRISYALNFSRKYVVILLQLLKYLSIQSYLTILSLNHNSFIENYCLKKRLLDLFNNYFLSDFCASRSFRSLIRFYNIINFSPVSFPLI